ncbi:MAG: DUF393 domain-containing protein [Pseudomonadota bacterium]
MTAPTAPRLTVYFDGGCPVCTREMRWYQGQRGAEAINWVDVTRCDAAALGDDLSREAALVRLHVRLPGGRLCSGARGFAALWSALPATRRAGWVASRPGIVHALELGYRAFLKLRRLWRGSAPRCRLPH